MNSATRVVELRVPTLDELPQYVEALHRGFSPDNIRGKAAADDELAAIERDPANFVALQVDREARGGPIKQLDGTLLPRLPGYRLFIWDGEFCGTIGFRWQPGTSELPPHVLGHIGYAVAPWKQRQGCATAALGLMLQRAAGEGLEYVTITTDLDNEASQKVIVANGGTLLGRFHKPASLGGKESLRYRIDLPR